MALDMLTGMFAKGDGAGGGGIFGMVAKFEAMMEEGKRAQVESAQIQLAILTELRKMNEHLAAITLAAIPQDHGRKAK